MSTQNERDQFVATMTTEGLDVQTIRLLLRHAATLHRIAELECSSEAADRDRVPCPGAKRETLCCCDFGYRGPGTHESVPRVSAQGARIEARVRALLTDTPIKPEFQGDPRGCVLKLHVPSGRDEGWGGVGVPS